MKQSLRSHPKADTYLIVSAAQYIYNKRWSQDIKCKKASLKFNWQIGTSVIQKALLFPSYKEMCPLLTALHSLPVSLQTQSGG